MENKIGRLKAALYFDRPDKIPQVDEFVDITQNYKTGDIIEPNSLVQQSDITGEDVYSFLELCAHYGAVQNHMMVRCPKCGKYADEGYGSALMIPSHVLCHECGNKIGSALSHAVSVYKVL